MSRLLWLWNVLGNKEKWKVSPCFPRFFFFLTTGRSILSGCLRRDTSLCLMDTRTALYIICGLLTLQYLAINDDLEAAQTLFQQDFIMECLIEGCFVMWQVYLCSLESGSLRPAGSKLKPSMRDFSIPVHWLDIMKHFIYTFTSILHGLIRTHKWPTPNVSGFIAQLVRASHRYREVTGSNPVEVLTISGFYIRNCLNCVRNCDDHSSLDLILLSI